MLGTEFSSTNELRKLSAVPTALPAPPGNTLLFVAAAARFKLFY